MRKLSNSSKNWLARRIFNLKNTLKPSEPLLNSAKNINPKREDEINAKIAEYKSIEKDLLFVKQVDEKGIREIRQEEVDRPNAIRFEQAQILFDNKILKYLPLKKKMSLTHIIFL